MNAEVPKDEKQAIALQELDEASCARAGALSAYGFGPQEICDTLQIEIGQLMYAMAGPIYREAYTDKIQERAMRQIDLSDGWDGVEQNAVAKVLSALQYSEDPHFALKAAMIANRAQRKVGGAAQRTVDASRVGSTVHLTMNMKFVTSAQERGGVIDVTPGDKKVLPRKVVDMPTAQKVSDMLAPARPLLEAMRERTLLGQFDEMHFGEIKDK